MSRDMQAAAEAPESPSPRGALASLSLAMLLSSLGTSIANVGLPSLAQAFDASFREVQWVVLAYLLAITTLIVSAGRLGDIVGYRSLLLMGIVLFTVASALCGGATTLSILIVARAVQGLGAAIMMALALAFVGRTVSKEKTGQAMGLLGTMSAVGTALGPSLGGLLIALSGWRAIFLINLPLGCLAGLLAYRFLSADDRDRNRASATRSDFDIAGTLLLAATLGAYALAMTLGRTDFGARNVALLSFALIGGGLFVLVEGRVRSPLIHLAMLRDAVLGKSLLINILVSTVMMATLVVGPFYLARGLGFDPATVGLLMSVGPVTSALSGVLAGRIVDRFGAPRMIILGLIQMAIGTSALALAPAPFGVIGYVAAILILSPGYQLFQAANNTTVMTSVSPDQRGVVSGMLSLSRNLGLITGAAAMGAVFAFGSGSTDVAIAQGAAVARGMQMTFAAATVLIAVGIALAVRGEIAREA